MEGVRKTSEQKEVRFVRGRKSNGHDTLLVLGFPHPIIESGIGSARCLPGSASAVRHREVVRPGGGLTQFCRYQMSRPSRPGQAERIDRFQCRGRPPTFGFHLRGHVAHSTKASGVIDSQAGASKLWFHQDILARAILGDRADLIPKGTGAANVNRLVLNTDTECQQDRTCDLF